MKKMTNYQRRVIEHRLGMTYDEYYEVFNIDHTDNYIKISDEGVEKLSGFIRNNKGRPAPLQIQLEIESILNTDYTESDIKPKVRKMEGLIGEGRRILDSSEYPEVGKVCNDKIIKLNIEIKWIQN